MPPQSPPPKKERKFQYGNLTKDNRHAVAERLLEMFRGKIWSVASLVVGYDLDISLINNNILRNLWSGGSKELVVVRDDALLFLGKSYVYTFVVREDGRNNAHFAFDRWGVMRVQEKTPRGDENLFTFCVERDMPRDPEEYDASLLTAHFAEPLTLACSDCVADNPSCARCGGTGVMTIPPHEIEAYYRELERK